MKKITLLSLFLGLALSLPAFGQTALTMTTLSAAVAAGSGSVSPATTVRLTSATGVVANTTILFVDGEAMFVNSVSGTAIGVTRGYQGTPAYPHIALATVLL